MNFVILILCLIQFGYSFRPEVTLYSEYDYTGTALTLRTKEADLRSVAPRIVNEYKSICLNGLWSFYSEEEYYGAYESSIQWNADTPMCRNNSRYLHDKSARFLGPQDTDRPTISFYDTFNYIGKELVVDGPAFAAFEFVPKSLFTTGFSNWTLYSGDNFDGTATCLTSTNEYHLISNMTDGLHDVNSILRGCPSKLAKKIFLS